MLATRGQLPRLQTVNGGTILVPHRPTPEQARNARDGRHQHRGWLENHAIKEPGGWLQEAPYTGILLAALLDPSVRETVASALLGGIPQAPEIASRPLTLCSSPPRVMDLVLGFGEQPDLYAVVVEHKRFQSPANYCYSAAGEWLPQTDVAVEDATADPAPLWLWGVRPGQARTFVLLDLYDRPVSQLFAREPANGGRHSHHWRTVSYAAFGAALRSTYDSCSLPGLVPLLASLYDDSGHYLKGPNGE